MLQGAGLRLLRRNFKTPGRSGGEIDLIMLEPDGTVVFDEVRHRRQMRKGGAAASVDARKQARIVWAARHYLAGRRQLPPCRFDVVAFDGHWQAAHAPRHTGYARRLTTARQPPSSCGWANRPIMLPC
jgi:putative endonuclease